MAEYYCHLHRQGATGKEQKVFVPVCLGRQVDCAVKGQDVDFYVASSAYINSVYINFDYWESITESKRVNISVFTFIFVNILNCHLVK